MGSRAGVALAADCTAEYAAAYTPVFDRGAGTHTARTVKEHYT